MRFFFGLCLLLCVTQINAQAIYDSNSVFHPVIAESGHGMVVAQEVFASEVGAQILAEGGNAIDAAVATGFALAVTYPQAGNLGGGGFMVVHLADKGEFHALDYREVAPISAHKNIFLNDDGSVNVKMKRYGVQSVGVPGTVYGLLDAQRRWGKLSRRAVLEPAIKLAKDGFPVSHALFTSLTMAEKRLQNDAAKKYFLTKKGKAPQPNTLLVQKDLANSLKRISKKGIDGFYKGKTASLLIDQIDQLGGELTQEDLDNYKAVYRVPVQGEFNGYEIVTMPPPSSGGVHILQMLNTMEHADLLKLEHNSADYLHVMAEAMRQAFADRSLFMGDPDFVPVPIEHLISKQYGRETWSKINMEIARLAEEIAPANLIPHESSETTHFSVWDSEGNVVSNTYTLNFSYGNGIAVAGAGFLLNNEMDDFSAKPGALNGYGLVGSEANAVQPGKRPLSSMTPTIVLKNGKPVLATGSPGGSRIITAVLQSLLNVLVFDMNANEAVSAPKIHHQWKPNQLWWEPGISIDTRRLLEKKGHNVAEKPRTFARLQVIKKNVRGLEGATDPRWPGGGVIVQPEK